MLTALLLAAAAFLQHASAPEPARATKTQNVILVMSDGLRWEEVFRGADDRLIDKKLGGVSDADALRTQFSRPTPEEARRTLMPFLWSTVAQHGQIFGNRDKGSLASVTNTRRVSYPGYSETFCGFADPAIEGNSKILNKNTTVFEWLHGKKAFHGRVAAFGAWDVFPYIFNAGRCGFPVDDGCAPFPAPAGGPAPTPAMQLIGRMRTETGPRWNGASQDAPVFHMAIEWLRTAKPRAMFLGLGETDEWAHEGRYDRYLQSAHRADAYLKELWDALQSMPEYKDSTSILFTCDHGRGAGGKAPDDWRHHGPDQPGADEIWAAVMGPDTPPLGEHGKDSTVTQSQFAATLAALVGEDWCAAEPRAGKPITAVLAK